jgi:hypothetical protein
MKNALAVLFGLVAAVVLAEVGLRAGARFHAPVRYLVTAGDAAEQPVFRSLEAYLASRGDLIPHGDFLNYWNNAFGLNDVEFVVPKPPGRFRIMALGDSFTYGSVPYPDAVMTRLEEALRAYCPGIDLDLLNFGIGGTSVWDYKTLLDLAGPTFDPDLVLVNLYLGNDGPDLFARPPSFRGLPRSLRKSYLARYVVNLIRVATSLERQVTTTGISRPQWTAPPNARGGHMVNSAAPIHPHSSRLIGPIYTPESFVEIMWGEYRRFARPPGAPSVQRTWGPTLSILDLLRHQVTGQGRRMVISLYPSVLQIYPGTLAQLEGEFRQRLSGTALGSIEVDPLLPNRVVLEYCRVSALACYDPTADFIASSRQSTEPLYKARDTHWTVRGNRVAAEAQARWLHPFVCPRGGWDGHPRRRRDPARRRPAPSSCTGWRESVMRRLTSRAPDGRCQPP